MDLTDYVTRLQMLLPPGEYFEMEDAQWILAMLRGLAKEFSRIQDDITSLLKEINPLHADHIFLEDWARIFDLNSLDLSIEATKRAVIRKLSDEAGQNREAYEKLIRSYGFEEFEIDPCYSSTVDELTCESVLYDEGWVHIFYIRIKNIPIYYLNCESYCNEYLWEEFSMIFQRDLNKRILAHKKVFIGAM